MKGRKESPTTKVVVTGMGFALPGEKRSDGTRELCKTKEQFWEIISKGKSCIENNGHYYGYISQNDDELQSEIKGIPDNYLKNYNKTHLMGLISCQEACRDAGLEVASEDFANASVITARTSISTCYDSLNEFIQMDYKEATPRDTLNMFNRLMLSTPVNDAAIAQAAMLKSGGDQFAVACGCASGGVAIGLAYRMILTGQVDCVVVSGVESISETMVDHYLSLVDLANETGKKASFDAPATQFIVDKLMAPYDKDACGFNAGIGAATIIMESEERAIARKAEIYGEVMNQATARGGSSSAVSLDQTGAPLVKAINDSIKNHVEITDIDYVNGGAQGDRIFNIFEAKAMETLFGKEVEALKVTSQEACFGHNAAALGITGVAGTLLMIKRNEICPTTGCRVKDEVCRFDPLPGEKTLEKEINYALSFNYQAGGVCSCILLGRN